jgi:hypothetical protein
MSRTIHRLKPLTVERAKNPGRYADGGGLYLVVKPGPRKSWAFIYRRDAKMTELGLGGVDSVSLSDARSEAAELRGVMATGGDPKAHRERKRQAKPLEDARSVTFEAAARAYHKRHAPNWRNDRYSHQWLRALELHAFPAIGSLGVGTIDLPAIKKVLEPIWYDKPRVAQVVRASVASVLNFAYAEGQRTGDNPARWDLLKHALPARRGARAGGHFRALSYSDMPSFLRALEGQTDAFLALCMRFTILTAARTKESIACRWADINWANRTRAVQIHKGGHEPWQHQVAPEQPSTRPAARPAGQRRACKRVFVPCPQPP